MFLHFDCVPLCFVFSEGRKEGVHHLLAEQTQCFDSLLACELRGDVKLLEHSFA